MSSIWDGASKSTDWAISKYRATPRKKGGKEELLLQQDSPLQNTMI